MSELVQVPIPSTNNLYMAGSDGVVRRRGRALSLVQGRYRVVTNERIISITPDEAREMVANSILKKDTLQNAPQRPQNALGRDGGGSDDSKYVQTPQTHPGASVERTEHSGEKPQKGTPLTSLGVSNRIVAMLSSHTPQISTLEDLEAAFARGDDLLGIRGIGEETVKLLQGLIPEDEN